MNRVVLRVPDLHCDGCIASISYALETFPGVHDVRGSLEESTLTIDYDLASITPLAMKAQLAAIGYPVADARDL